MELNKKSIEILQYLIDKDDFVKVEELAHIYKLTDRAIRYNIDKIEKFLVKNGFDYFQRQHNKGIKLIKENGVEKFIEQFVNTRTPHKYIYSKEERFQFIIVKLLQSSAPVKIAYFEKILYISKNTVLRELDIVQEWLSNRNILLNRKPRVGITVEGREIDKRKAIMEISSESISTEELLNYMNKKIVNSKLSNLQFENLFSDVDLDFLDGLIKRAELELNRSFSDETYVNLITHIALMIKRIQLNKNIYIPDINMEGITSGKEYEAALKITKGIEKHYNIIVPESEIKYIILHLLGAKVLNVQNSYDLAENKVDGLYDVTKAMTREIQEIYNVDFGDMEEKLIQDLLVHLRPSIYRIKFKLKLENPLFDQIRTEYKELFLNTKRVIRHLADYIQEKINDQEISYITLHFGAALKNVERHVEKSKVVIVCGTGVGTANMVASQISNDFDVEIVATISCRALKSINKIKYDYIISTVDIPELNKKKYIKISPLILKKDFEKLKGYLQVKYKPQKDDLHKVDKLISIVEKYCDIHDRQQLQYEFLYEMRKNRDDIVERRFVYMLKDLLNRETIKLEVECKDMIQAIKAGTKLLLDKEYIEPSYEKAIIKNYEELGPYMVVAPGIALNHARPENGVNRVSMSLITLKQPVKFGSDINDPVKLIVTLASNDNESHLKALSQLMELFMNEDDLKEIMSATNKEQVISIVSHYSE